MSMSQPKTEDFDMPELKRPNQQGKKSKYPKIRLKPKKIKQTIFDKFNNHLSRKKLQVELGSEDLNLLAELVLEDHEICILNFNPEEFWKWFILDHENNVVDTRKPLDLQNFLKPLICFQSQMPHYIALKGFVMKHLTTLIMETSDGDKEIELTKPHTTINKDDLDDVLLFIENKKDEAVKKVKNCLMVVHSNGKNFKLEFRKILRVVKEREVRIVKKMKDTIKNLETKIQNTEVNFVKRISSHKKFVKERKEYFERTTKNILELMNEKEQNLQKEFEGKIKSYEERYIILHKKIEESNLHFQKLKIEYDYVFENAREELASKIEELEKKSNIEIMDEKLEELQNILKIEQQKEKCKKKIECVVCLTKAREVAIFPCGHAQFCKDCVLQVMENSSKCPLCRKDIKEYKNIYYF